MPRRIDDEDEEIGWVTPRQGRLHDHRQEEETLPKAKTYNETAAPLQGRDEVPWTMCPVCHDLTRKRWKGAAKLSDINCYHCGGVGYLDVPIDDETCLRFEAGTVSRVVCYRARYRAGLIVIPRGATR